MLPPLITSANDIWSFQLVQNEPNYITLKSVTAPIIDTETAKRKEQLSGKILFITSADPGYDWIFSYDIAGFITMYGGVNSHMAIRASELGIPAVIGAGNLLYKRWAAADVIEIDCANRQVKIHR